MQNQDKGKWKSEYRITAASWLDRIYRLSLTGVLVGNVKRCCQQSHKVFEQQEPRSSSSVPHFADGKLRQAGRNQFSSTYKHDSRLSLVSFPYHFTLQSKSSRQGKRRAFPKAIGAQVVELKLRPRFPFPILLPSSLRAPRCLLTPGRSLYDNSFLRIKKSFKIHQNHTQMEKLQALWWGDF